MRGEKVSSKSEREGRGGGRQTERERGWEEGREGGLEEDRPKQNCVP